MDANPHIDCTFCALICYKLKRIKLYELNEAI